MVAAGVGRVQAALQPGERAGNARHAQLAQLEADTFVLGAALLRETLRQLRLIRRENTDGEAIGVQKGGVAVRRARQAEEHQRWIERERTERGGREAPDPPRR